MCLTGLTGQVDWFYVWNLVGIGSLVETDKALVVMAIYVFFLFLTSTWTIGGAMSGPFSRRT